MYKHSFDVFFLQLTRDDLHLLGQMYLAALNVIRIKGCQRDDFKIGYHAEPSMQHLHMHVISTDFDSPTLKTQRHWNSFHTELFIPHQGKSEHICIVLHFYLNYVSEFSTELIARITEEGEIMRLDYRIIDQLRRTPLKCHRCSARLNKISNLKWHLRTYHSER